MCSTSSSAYIICIGRERMGNRCVHAISFHVCARETANCVWLLLRKTQHTGGCLTSTLLYTCMHMCSCTIIINTMTNTPRMYCVFVWVCVCRCVCLCKQIAPGDCFMRCQDKQWDMHILSRQICRHAYATHPELGRTKTNTHTHELGKRLWLFVTNTYTLSSQI